MRILGGFFLMLLMVAPLASQAEMASLFGLGPKSSAMGGTAIRTGKYDPFQVYTSPAALGYLRRVEFSVGALYLEPRIQPFGTLVLNSNGQRGDFPDAGVLPGGGSLMGFAVPVGRVRPVTLGGAIFMPFTSMIRVSSTPVGYPFYPLYTDLSRNFFFIVGGGYEFVDGWSVGMNLRSTTKSTAYYVLRSDSSINQSASAVEAKSESRVSVNLLYDNARRHPNQPWSLGAMYRGYSGMETKLQADVTALGLPIQGELTSYPAYTPAEWVLMASVRPSLVPNWACTFSGDISRVMWSAYRSPYGNGNINSYVIGGRSQEVQFNDVTVLRFGMEQEMPVSNNKVLRKLATREGYQFHPSPAPDQTGDTNFVDNDRHMFSLGMGFGFKSPFKEEDIVDLDLFFQYNSLKKRTYSKNSATTIGAPGYDTGGKILIYGAGTSMKF